MSPHRATLSPSATLAFRILVLPDLHARSTASPLPRQPILIALLSAAIVLSSGCSSPQALSPARPACQPAPDPVPGDCRAPACGHLVESASDLPADDGNPCTREACSPGPAHVPLPEGTRCRESGVCNGSGKCLDCTPGTSVCSSSGRRVCSVSGTWENRSGCEPDAPICASGACVSVRQIVTGLQHACALLSNHTVRCWGANVQGSLGTADPGAFRAVVPQPLSLPPTVQLAAGPGHMTCARHSDGSVTCWGPGSPRGLLGAADLAVGTGHGCAVMRDASVVCWGVNAHGQLGDGTLQDRDAPVRVAGLPPAAKVACSESHTCAILADSTVRCWGSNLWGESGLDRSEGFPSSAGPVRAGHRAASPTVVEGLSGATALALGTGRSCALLSDATVWCWGDPADKNGQSFESRPRRLSQLASVTSLSASGLQLCAVDGGEAKCLGLNGQGQLGDGTWRERSFMAAVAGLGKARGIATSREHACAWLEDGEVACWGSVGGVARKEAERIRW